MPTCRSKVSSDCTYFKVKHGQPALAVENRVLTPVRAESFDVYLNTFFLCRLYRTWCCHQGLFKDSVIHSWYIFSVVLLPLPPPLNTSCYFFPLLCAQWSSFLTDSKSDRLQRDLGLFGCSLPKCTMSCFSKSNRNSWSLASPSMAIFSRYIALYFCRVLAAKIPKSLVAWWVTDTPFYLGVAEAPGYPSKKLL